MARPRLNDPIQTHVRMREALRKQVETSAKSNRVSMNREMVNRIERSFDLDEIEKFIEIAVRRAIERAFAMLRSERA